MATWTKLPLSGSTNGKRILVTQIASPGDTIHTTDATTGVDNYDEIWINAFNSDTANQSVTLQWGGTTAPNDSITLTLAPQAGLILVVAGDILQNSLVVKAFASVANKITVGGFVNRSAA